MIRFAPGVSNRLWILRSMRPGGAFQVASQDPRTTQLRLLRSLLRRNASSEYGSRFGFAGIRTVEAYRRQVPVVRYDDLAPEMEAIQSGRQGVLTEEPILLLQPSSGSTAATKLIPYTASLRREFNRAVSVWMADLFWARPGLLDGPAYWSVSPQAGPMPGVAGAVRVGFDDDAAYLGGLTRAIVAGALAVPAEVGKIRELEGHRYATLRYLLAASELRIISAWSPTFLSLLLECLVGWWERLVGDVEAGTLTLPGEVGPGEDLPLPAPDPRRARELRAVGPDDLPGIWPRLGLLSAWADGPSGPYARALRRSFPGVPLQPKGLIATEAFVSFPRWGLPGAHPAVTSHFLEFLPENAGVEDALMVDELTEGERYEVLVTTGGGLYRYRLGDLVEVVGKGGGLPCLRFAGRADRVSDRFGEKLSDGFVTRVVETLCAEEGLDPAFSLLAPEDEGAGARYVWYLASSGSSEGLARALADGLEAALSENFHYGTCRRLGQLSPVAVRLVSDSAAARYLSAKGKGAARLGEVKIPALETTTGWGNVLDPAAGRTVRGGAP